MMIGPVLLTGTGATGAGALTGGAVTTTGLATGWATAGRLKYVKALAAIPITDAMSVADFLIFIDCGWRESAPS